MEEFEEGRERPVFKDIRRYYCEYCGICRSKKTLIASHISNYHKDESQKKKDSGDGEPQVVKSNTCEECGASFKKPAYLMQHMQSHSLERPYKCHIDDCHSCFRRKDHLTRHLQQHVGTLYKCPIENCDKDFTLESNMKRHVKELHEGASSTNNIGPKMFVCPESGCGKTFLWASRLRRHEDTHIKLESVEAMCLEPDCMKTFANAKCLRAHVQSCHGYTTCEICGQRQLKKNMKRHLHIHETDGSLQKIKCEFEGCLLEFSNLSNLRTHVKAVHFKEKPYVCGFSGCSMKFSYKHVRDNHEKRHAYSSGDFVESDLQFRSRPRGGRKRTYPNVEMLIRKRVTPPSQWESWLLGRESD